MRTFLDNQQQQWSITIDAPTILRVRAGTCDVANCKHLMGSGCTGVDIGDPEESWKARCRRDVVLLVNTIYLICQPEAHAKGVTDAGFGALIVGDAIKSATIAMDEAIADFFPEENRVILRALTAKDEEVRKGLREDIDRRLVALLQANARASTSALARALGLARSTVHERIARLERIGAITGYAALLSRNPSEDNSQALVMLSVNQQKSRQVVDRLSALPEIKLAPRQIFTRSKVRADVARIIDRGQPAAERAAIRAR